MFRRAVTFTAMLIVCLAGNAASAALDDIAEDGWHTWRVAATDAAPNWCCFVWNGGNAQTRNCDLDSTHINYGSAGEVVAGVSEMQLYALIAEGNVSKLRTLSPQCQVTSQSTVTDLGLVAGDESITWLKPHIAPRTRISTHALAAISVHAGSAPLDLLAAVARDGDNFDNRINAVFWLAQTGAIDSEVEIQKAIRREQKTEVREQAIFALSQLPDERATNALIDVIEDRRLSNADRKHALFWLAQLDSDAALAYLGRLLGSR